MSELISKRLEFGIELLMELGRKDIATLFMSHPQYQPEFFRGQVTIFYFNVFTFRGRCIIDLSGPLDLSKVKTQDSKKKIVEEEIKWILKQSVEVLQISDDMPIEDIYDFIIDVVVMIIAFNRLYFDDYEISNLLNPSEILKHSTLDSKSESYLQCERSLHGACLVLKEYSNLENWKVVLEKLKFRRDNRSLKFLDKLTDDILARNQQDFKGSWLTNCETTSSFSVAKIGMQKETKKFYTTFQSNSGELSKRVNQSDSTVASKKLKEIAKRSDLRILVNEDVNVHKRNSKLDVPHPAAQSEKFDSLSPNLEEITNSSDEESFQKRNIAINDEPIPRIPKLNKDSHSVTIKRKKTRNIDSDSKWTDEDTLKLVESIRKYGRNWVLISLNTNFKVPKSNLQCRARERILISSGRYTIEDLYGSQI